MLRKILFILCSAFSFFIFLSPANIYSEETGDRRAAEILQRVRREYEESIEGIDDYIMVTENFTILYKKVWDNGRPYFKSRMEGAPYGNIDQGMETFDSDLFSPDIYPLLKKNALYRGEKYIDGVQTHVLHIEKADDFDGLDEFTLFIDTETLLTRRIEFTIKEKEGKMEALTEFRDYKNIEGMFIPFKTLITITGLDSAMTEEEREEARKAIDIMERELQQMSPQQREMAREFMGEHIEVYRSMLEDYTISFNLDVKEVKVNTGLVFD